MPVGGHVGEREAEGLLDGAMEALRGALEDGDAFMQLQSQAHQSLVEGNLEATLPTICTDGKAQPGRSRARKKLGRGESQKGENEMWRKAKEKVGKSPNIMFFQCFVAPEG